MCNGRPALESFQNALPANQAAYHLVTGLIPSMGTVFLRSLCGIYWSHSGQVPSIEMFGTYPSLDLPSESNRGRERFRKKTLSQVPGVFVVVSFASLVTIYWFPILLNEVVNT